MKVNRFLFTVPLAVFINAIMDLIVAMIAIVTAVVAIPITFTKELCLDEVRREHKHELAEVERRIAELENQQNDTKGGA